ncbi:MAG TPA: DegT/DnrJ/EryC1/StrS family aminotransferase [Bryobacteraceae bacterium]|jgi:dTDP-4-amino-4,6-dideoxygalactose transaminase|nr:DegT/DnrJ/EryC1/StrS family aminotransferase [Bryobacteraceae bacterium]
MKTILESIETPAYWGGSPAFEERFRFISPLLPPLDEVWEEYRAAYEGGIITNAACVRRFEEQSSAYLGVRDCVGVSSCTSGLTLVMRALGLAGEVIVPSFTFFATAHAIRWNGLTPVLVDCDRETWNVDPADVEQKITTRTSTILAVHMYGNPANVDVLTSLARKHNLKLIFDAAHAFGSQRRGAPVGQFGDAEVFSLSPTKLLVAGEGGLVATADPALARAIRLMRNYGDDGSYDPQFLGQNARLGEFNAALGLRGLPLVDSKVERRNQIARLYVEGLSGLPGVTFQKVDHGDRNTYKDFSIHVNSDLFGCTRDQLAVALLAENIETKKYFYPPLHKQTLYREFEKSALPNTNYVADNVLSLPIYETLPDSTIARIVDCIKRIQCFAAYRSFDTNPKC